VHVFCHRAFAYAYETNGAGDWMARTFFTGGLMPSADLFAEFQRDLVLDGRWEVGGEHYARTAEAWLANLDRGRAALRPVLEATYGARDAARWFERWRLFFLACAELFAYGGGREWFVGHDLLRPRPA
jgi:cyclopropane-fatty-acyl-phospholipid synthase